MQLDALKHLIQLLPIVNRNTLHALLRFLSILAKFAEDTRDAHGKYYLRDNLLFVQIIKLIKTVLIYSIVFVVECDVCFRPSNPR